MAKEQPWEYMDDNIVLFWGGILSNWYKSPFDIDDMQYNCVEQFMMYRKAMVFGDGVTAQMIMQNGNPREQKMLGRKVQNFDAAVWEACCLEEVLPGILSKFGQNESLKELLLSTGNRIIAEASPYDAIWGIGLGVEDPDALDPAKWQGKNYLGELLMVARDWYRATVIARERVGL
jgi:ribA/ribD-fused uncharacterized protein